MHLSLIEVRNLLFVFFVVCSLGSAENQLTLPESTTNLIPSIVTEVSAMLVEMIHFRTPSGDTSKTFHTRVINTHKI